MTRTSPLYISRGNVTVASNRLHLNLPTHTPIPNISCQLDSNCESFELICFAYITICLQFIYRIIVAHTDVSIILKGVLYQKAAWHKWNFDSKDRQHTTDAVHRYLICRVKFV